MIQYDIPISNGIMSDGRIITIHIFRSLGGTYTSSCLVIVQVCKAILKLDVFSHVFCFRRKNIAIQCLLKSAEIQHDIGFIHERVAPQSRVQVCQLCSHTTQIYSYLTSNISLPKSQHSGSEWVDLKSATDETKKSAIQRYEWHDCDWGYSLRPERLRIPRKKKTRVYRNEEW